MTWENRSVLTEFVFLAYPSHPELRVLSLLGISLVYTLFVIGNVLILVAIQTEACLHKPMYYFLSSLLGVEICYTAVVVPHILATSYSQRKPSPSRAVPLRWFSSLDLAVPIASFWLSWPMTGMLPFATPCDTLSS